MAYFQKYTLFWTEDDDVARTGAMLAGMGGGQISGPIAGGMGNAGKGIPAAPICATAVNAANKNCINQENKRTW